MNRVVLLQVHESYFVSGVYHNPIKVSNIIRYLHGRFSRNLQRQISELLTLRPSYTCVPSLVHVSSNPPSNTKVLDLHVYPVFNHFTDYFAVFSSYTVTN